MILQKIAEERYYDQGGIIVQRATREDAEYIAFNMRRQDINEIWDAGHMTPAEAMRISIENTVFCLSIRIDGIPAAIFGVNGESIIGCNGTIWLLGTEKIKDIGFRFVRHSRKFVDIMLGFYPYLSNYVSVENTISIAWLKSLGALMLDPVPYGVEGKKFCYFSFRRGA